jgi:hypothetical protein
MCHVTLDKVTRCQSSVQRKLSGKNRGSNDACKFASIISGSCWMRAFYTKKVKHSTLRFQYCPAAKRPDLNRRHRNANLQITPQTVRMLVFCLVELN